jgi:hypothetical protein
MAAINAAINAAITSSLQRARKQDVTTSSNVIAMSAGGCC